jgi:hypothetical protein
MADWLTIPADNDVALVNACLSSWAFGIDVHHHHATSTTLDGDKLKAEAEVAPRDVSVLLKPCRDTLDSSGRNNEDALARSKHCHANRMARRINGKTAFGTSSHTDIKFDASIDLATTQGIPGADATGHHAKRRRWRTVFSTNRNCKRANSDGRRLQLKVRYVGATDAQQGDVGSVIASYERSRDWFTARQRDADLTFLG